jgi:arginyl-tRNA synthetase
MSNPTLALSGALKTAIAKAFGPSTVVEGAVVRRSTHADFQADVAMALAKRLGLRPRDVAAKIADALPADQIYGKVEIAGPGFINIDLRDDALARMLTEMARDPSSLVAPSAAPEIVVVDLSSPNIAKEMHVGHLRSTILGDALARVLEAVGHRVVRQNHIGDWGTPFGMLIEHLLDLGSQSSREASIADLDAFYRQARTKFDSDPHFAERSRRRVVLLQGGDDATLGLWRRLVEESMRYINGIYRRLDVTLTAGDIAGESFYNRMLPEVVAELQARGLATEDEGAICTFPPGFSGRNGAALPLIIRKQDGGYNYAATDLAAIRYRVQSIGARRILYVIGAPQAQHLAMVFGTAKQAGWLPPETRAEQVAFGSVLGTDKKPFRSRSGDSIKLELLLDEAESRAAAIVREKNTDLEPSTIAAIAHAVGIGAVKYADLSTHRIRDYVFDWDRMLSLEGNTAPYLMYAHARICSIFRKSAVPASASAAIVLHDPAERALAMELLDCSQIVHEVAETLEPHRLCGYLYGLATKFAVFYQQCPVLRAETEELRQSRLMICRLTARVLGHHLDLLGIRAPESM